MTLTVFLAVLLAAVLHATWNALVKGGLDKHVAMTAVVLGHVPLAVLALPFIPLPALAGLPWLFAGIALHLGRFPEGQRIGQLFRPRPRPRPRRRPVGRPRAGRP